MLTRAPAFSLWDAMPSAPWNRFHVDWILFARPATGAQRVSVEPLFVAAMDARASSFSSDHFPVVAIFKLNHHHLP
jgi:hypothetical protein